MPGNCTARTSLSLAMLATFYLGGSVSASAEPRIRIATWNFGFLAEKDGVGCFERDGKAYARLQEYTRRLDADVVAVQEVENEAALARVFDPSLYELHVSQSVGFTPSPCDGAPDQSLIEQRVGFAVRKTLKANGLEFKRLSDVTELAVQSGGHRVRPGLNLELRYKDAVFHFLSVHLKSGCFDKRLPDRGEACVTLWKQANILERWIDERTARSERVVVLGDFNRRLAEPGDAFWNQLDDSEPANSDLEYITLHGAAECGPYTKPIDHIVLDKGADLLIDERSARYVKYDEPWERAPADHCPLSVELELRAISP
jgi:endonuclease/exonuclease/phosphatase family metal-dependent hydrolase